MSGYWMQGAGDRGTVSNLDSCGGAALAPMELPLPNGCAFLFGPDNHGTAAASARDF